MYDVYQAAVWDSGINKLVYVNRDGSEGDYVLLCNSGELEELVKAKNIVYHGMQPKSELSVGYEITSDDSEPMKYCLKKEYTLWDLLILLNKLHAVITYRNRTWKIQDIRIDPNRDVGYLGNYFLWDRHPKFLNPGVRFHVEYRGTEDSLVGFKYLGDVQSSNGIVSFDFYPGYCAYTWSYSYSMLRLCSTELGVLADNFLFLLGYVAGFELGYALSQGVYGISYTETRDLKHYLHTLNGISKARFSISFPNRLEVQKHWDELKQIMAKDKTEGMHMLQSICKADGVYTQMFCQGFISQIADDLAVTDHEYMLNSRCYEALWDAFVRLYSYILTLEVFEDALISTDIPLAGGFLHIERRH